MRTLLAALLLASGPSWAQQTPPADAQQPAAGGSAPADAPSPVQTETPVPGTSAPAASDIPPSPPPENPPPAPPDSTLPAKEDAAQPPSLSPQGALETLAAPGPNYGIPLSPDKGPWLLGDVRFVGNQSVSSYALQSRVRARRGTLYTPSDLANDIQELRGAPNILSIRAEVYAIPGQKVPEQYQSVSISTMMARIVFEVEEKKILLPGLTPAAPAVSSTGAAVAQYPPSSISGVLLTPTAYRGYGRYNTPGLGLDFNAAYYIGRLYGKNSVSLQETNYLDRIGVWFLTADGKMQLQSETAWRPAVAAGAEALFTFRDGPQPTINSPGVSVNVSADTTRTLSGGYVVMSKKFWGLRSSLGYMYGSAGEAPAMLTEFLSPQSLQFLYNKGAGIQAKSKDTLFGSLMLLPKPQFPLAVEFMKPNGMVLNPILFNFKVGYFLKLNFDVAYLKFDGGWDLLGVFQFRFTQFPRG